MDVGAAGDGSEALVDDESLGSLQVDARGRVRVEVSEAGPVAPVWRELVLFSSEPAPGERARRRLPPGTGAIDLGTIELVAPHPVFAGRVLDELDRPIPSAVVQASHSVGSKRGPELLHGSVAARHADAGGRFELFGWTDGVPMRLGVSAADREPTTLAGLITPSLDLEVVLFPSDAASLLVQISVDAGRPTRMLAVWVRRSDGDGPGEELRLRHGPEDGSRTLRPIDPGVYTLDVRHAWSGDQLARFEGVRVDAHAEVDDPRLQPIDLRGSSAGLRVRSVDSHGQPLGFYKIPLVSEERAGSELLTNESGWAELPLPIDAPNRIAIDAFGRQVELLDGAEVVVLIR